MTLPDLMLDLETLGTSTDAAIVAIGACWFDVKAGTVGDAFHRRVDLTKSASPGKVDVATVEWWLKKDKVAIGETFWGSRVALEHALEEFSKWVGDPSLLTKVALWSNAPTFDEAILRSAWARHYDAVLAPFPFAYYHSRCYRTLLAVAKETVGMKAIPFVGTAHCALDDAIHQANSACAAWKALAAR